MNLKEREELKKFIDENKRSGRIRESTPPMASPFFFIKKADGSLRAIQDYRKLNESTIKNKYPLPLIGELIDKVKTAKFITKLDVRWGYYNIRIREGDEWKAAFRTNEGLFEPTVMFFGLCNAPATFQAFVNNIFRDLIGLGKIVIYLDDILIFVDDLEEHRRLVKQVFQILKDNKLYLKPSKCEFEVSTVKFLGYVLGNGEIRMDTSKVDAVRDWPDPKNKKELQRFLSLGNWLRRFVKGYSATVKPLTRLTGDVDWEWNTEQKKAFQLIKDKLTSAPVLAIPNDDDSFQIETNASDYATGEVLLQKQDGNWKVIVYRSAALTSAEWNYEIYDKELLAVVQALEDWRQYLLGAKHPIEVWTDHANLTYFRKPQDLNRRQARWSLFLSEFNFTFVHKLESLNVAADALSRRCDYDTGENDNQGITLLKEEWFKMQAIVEISRTSLQEQIKEANKGTIPREDGRLLVLKELVEQLLKEYHC